jgi:hypothetical protein
MAREDYAAALIAHLLQRISQAANAQDVEPVSGLVEHEVQWLMDEHTAKRHFHALSLREAASRCVGKLSEAQDIENIVHPLLDYVGRKAPELAKYIRFSRGERREYIPV